MAPGLYHGVIPFEALAGRDVKPQDVDTISVSTFRSLRLENRSMDPNKLLYFACIVEEGSLKKAAKQLSISQPALSTSMDRFERSLGDKVLDRSPTGVTPTPLGELLYAHARLIREELDRAKLRLTDDRNGDGIITLGTLPSLTSNIVPKAICAWRETHNAITLRVVEKNQLELLLSLVRGEVDFIVAQTEYYGLLEGMRQRVLFRDKLYILARPGHPALMLKEPSWADLAVFPWVIAMVSRQRTLLEELLSSDGAELPRQLTECSSVAGIKSLVAGSDCLSMLPASALGADVLDGKIVPLDLTNARLNRDIAVLFRAGTKLTDASRSLLSHIEAAGAGLSDEVPVPSPE
jgi:DNA-binding transcriptional LysR family regulator